MHLGHNRMSLFEAEKAFIQSETNVLRCRQPPVLFEGCLRLLLNMINNQKALHQIPFDHIYLNDTTIRSGSIWKIATPYVEQASAQLSIRPRSDWARSHASAAEMVGKKPRSYRI